MIRALHAGLILLLLLTGAALGAARGQARVAGQVILCAGHSVVAVPVGDDGQPVPRPIFCPDMALSLLAAGMDAPPAAPLVRQARRIGWSATAARGISRGLPARAARDPPSTLS